MKFTLPADKGETLILFYSLRVLSGFSTDKYSAVFKYKLLTVLLLCGQITHNTLIRSYFNSCLSLLETMLIRTCTTACNLLELEFPSINVAHWDAELWVS